MLRKPNAILHMTGFGAVYGFLIAMILIWIPLVFGANLSAGGQVITALLPLLLRTSAVAFMFGGISGALFGLIEGLVIMRFTYDATPPIDIAFDRKYIVASAINGVLTVIGMWGFLMLRLYPAVPNGINVTITAFVTLLFALIAGGAAVYATYRYLLKLRAWSRTLETSTSKAKHELKHQLSDEDDTPTDALDIHNDEAKLRMKAD